MINANLLEEIELKYNEYISDIKNENDNIITFVNEIVPNMYDYNFVYLKKKFNFDELIKIIDKEKKEHIIKGKNYLKVSFKINSTMPENIEYQKLGMDVNKISFMSIDRNKIRYWKMYDNIRIDTIKDNESLNKFIEFNYDEDSKISQQYAEDRKNLILKQYNKNFLLYLAYLNEKIVGTAEVFTLNGIAKIENIFVNEMYRNKGVCTELLRKIIKNNKEDFYLATYVNDEAIKLYKKLNFITISKQYSVLLNF